MNQRATIDDVSDTALWIAAYRAREHARPNGLFADPFAARLAGPKGAALATSMTGAEQFDWMTAIRTAVIDELILAEITRGVRTVLNLGAGLDSRPYRLPLAKDVRWIEVDSARLIAHKEQVLAAARPGCSLTRIAVDLADREARRRVLETIADADEGVVVLTEGVLGYLTEADVGSLADELRALGSVRAWIADYAARFLRTAMRVRGLERRHLKNAPLRFAPADWAGFFRAHGWVVREMRYLPIEGARLGRPLPMPAWWRPIHALLPTKARAAIDRMIGYGVLTPG
jgi:methyltransferase (TIGR00027 family)